ncbi:MAG: hypothetical protein NC912_04550 [Candidatus Omnitrophica bacterium]|nr:hypothetical protein [Candidatus Omnitrophota bacterium]
MKKYFLAGCLFFCFTSFCFAYWQKRLQLRWQHLYHYDLRQDKHQLYNNRISFIFSYMDKHEKTLFKIEPFFEFRRNINKDITERKELGIEIGKDIFTWFYIGEVIQQVWMNEDYRYYTDYEKRDFTNSETRLLFKHSLLNKDKFKLEGFILEEYTFDFNRQKGLCNEVAIGFIVPLGKHLQVNLNWRHIDRIHYYDSDTFETSLTLFY